MVFNSYGDLGLEIDFLNNFHWKNDTFVENVVVIACQVSGMSIFENMSST